MLADGVKVVTSKECIYFKIDIISMNTNGIVFDKFHLKTISLCINIKFYPY